MVSVTPSPLNDDAEYFSGTPEYRKTPVSKQEHRNPSTVPLTPLWEHVVRSKNLPESVDLDGLFKVIHQRVRNPEWTVRQHALRVLKDIIPLLGGGDSLDERMQLVLADIVANLGHLGPGVRKTAVDCLKTYLHHSQRTDRILHDLVLKGVKHANDFKVQPNMVLGIILALPFLLRGNKKISQNTIEFAIHCLLDKLVQVTHQDTVMRALLRIKESIGEKAFNGHLEMYWQPTIKKDFESLCDVYNLQSFTVEPGREHGKEPIEQDYCPIGDPEVHLGDVKKNFYYMKNESETKKRSMYPDSKDQSDKVILETEIKLDSGPAITMKIHEEISEDNSSESFENNTQEQNSDGKTFRVLNDSTDENIDFFNSSLYEQARRTPRKVRFGGEIVKMRTPDSDSNHHSDNETSPRVERPRGGGPKSLIPISTERPKKEAFLSLGVQSAPSSPSRTNDISPRNKNLSNSFPNLARKEEDIFGEKIDGSMSRIPLRSRTHLKKNQDGKPPRRKSPKSPETKVQSPRKSMVVLDIPTNNQDFDLNLNLNKNSPRINKTAKLELKPSKLDVPQHSPRSRNADRYSPIPIHNEIELMHNLTRSPERRPIKTEKPSVQTQTSTFDDQDDVNKNRDGKQRVFSGKNKLDKQQENLERKENRGLDYGYFQQGDVSIKNRGPCLTCSSTSSETSQENYVGNLENLGIIDRSLLRDLQNKEDIWKRHFALQELNQDMKFNPAIVESLEPNASIFLELIFSQMDQLNSLLLPLAEQTVILFVNKCNMKTLTSDKVQTVMLQSLSRLGSPVGVRMSLVLAQKIPPNKMIEKLVSQQILGAKSSKMREGCLQILMAICRLFPSTDIDVLSTVSRIVPSLIGDKKSKVRRAALESLAALAQISNPSMVLDVAANAAIKREDGEMLLGVVRSRLSRRQLPTVDVKNGTVRYPSPSKIEEDWVSLGTVSPPSTSSQENRSFSSSNHQNGSMSALGTRRPKMVSSEAPSILERPRRSSANVSTNYWKANSQKNRILGSSNCSPVIQKDNHLPVWAIDNKNFAVNQSDVFKPAPHTHPPVNLRPLYIGQTQTSKIRKDATTSYENINYFENDQPLIDRRLNSSLPNVHRPVRGRSFSPPKSHFAANGIRNFPNEHYNSDNEFKHNSTFESQVENTEQHRQYDGGGFYPQKYAASAKNRSIRKSFSNDHLTSADNKDFYNFYEPKRVQNIYNVSVSSGSSNTSGSFKSESSNWYRQGKSKNGFEQYTMPPISNNKNFKLRTTPNGNETRSFGPVQATTPVNVMNEIVYNNYKGVKTPSAQQKAKKFIVQEFENKFDTVDSAVTRQPFSSGSDSSGYFTPPAENNANFEKPQVEIISQKPDVGKTNLENNEVQTVSDVSPPQDVRSQQIQNIGNVESFHDQSDTYKSSSALENDEKSFVKVEDVNGIEENRPKSRVEILQNDWSDNESDQGEKPYSQSANSEIRRRSFSEDIKYSTKKMDSSLSKSYCDIQTPQNDFETARKIVSSAPSFKDNMDLNGKGLLEVSPVKFAKTPLPGAVALDDDEYEEENYSAHFEKDKNPNFTVLTEPDEIFNEYNTARFAQNEDRLSHQKIKPSMLPQPINKRKLIRTLSKGVVGPLPEGPVAPPVQTRQPREHVTDILLKLASPEWEKVVQGLASTGRLFKNNVEMSDPHLHQLATSVGRHIRNLRSQVARAACSVASEAFKHPRRSLDNELEEFAVPLLHRTADTNRFLRGDANTALDDMIGCSQLPTPKIIHVLTGKGASHQNAVVRCTAARLLCNLCQKLGPSKIFQLPKETRDRIMLFGANMLTEGSLDTRKHAKVMLANLAQHYHFQRAIEEAVPLNVRRHISKTLSSLK